MAAMAEIDLALPELRAVTDYAADRAQDVVAIFERLRPLDRRPRDAIAAAKAFAGGGERGKALRDTAWAALKAAQTIDDRAACEAARAAMCAPAAAFLHPLARATQVRHILGAAAHAARAVELAAGDDRAVGDDFIERAASTAGAAVIDVLMRYPMAPAGGGRTGELVRMLDRRLRGTCAGQAEV